MATGLFGIADPGLTYLGRRTFAIDMSVGLTSLDPSNAASVAEGEWLKLNADGTKVFRPIAGLGAGGIGEAASLNRPYLPLLLDKGRTDMQSAARVTLGMHKGAQCYTAGYATQDFSGPIIYTVGMLLVPVLARDPYVTGATAVNRVVLAPSTSALIGSPTVAGDIVDVGPTIAVARVIRTPYTLNGVGTPSRRTVIDIELL